MRYAEPSAEECEAALRSVLADCEFRTSPRRTALLSYLVEQALGGGSARLKETAIAIDVFGRGSDFDPRFDAIVRGEARRLRHSLASYYVGTGLTDPVVISIPKGSYLPQFSYRTAPAMGDTGHPGQGETPRPVVAVSAEDEGVAPLAGDAADLSPEPRPQAQLLRRIATAAVAAAACAGIVTLFMLNGRAESEADPLADPLIPDVFVEPLQATGSFDGVDALAAGISATLIADLMRFPGFRLYDYNESLAWPLAEDPAASTSPTKGDFVVRGVLLATDKDIALAVRLIDVPNGQIIWSETFNRPLTPGAIVEMQADVSGQIASSLGEPYGVLRGLRNAGVGVGQAEISSFSCVMQAFAYRHTNRADNYAETRACLEEAVVRDPGYADAWAMLGFLRLDGGRFGYDGDTPEARADAVAAARIAAATALSLDPKNVAATNAMATIEHYAGRFQESRAYSQRALDLNPNDPTTLGYHGWRLVARGRLDEGVPYLHKAIERSANPPPVFFHMIAVERLMKGDMEGMRTAVQRASVDGSSVSDALLAIAAGGLGDYGAAQEALDRVGTKWPLLAQDPAAAFGRHNLHPDVIAALVDGLRKAGWRPPEL
jgi:TolB-like protein/Tfp pilus assembly protein PilF